MNLNKVMTLLLAGLVCSGIVLLWLGRTRHDALKETVISVLLPEAADYERSIMSHYLEEAKRWISEYQAIRGKPVLLVSAPYHPDGVWYDQKLLTMMIGGSEPDVIFLTLDSLLELDAIEKLMDLDSLDFECDVRARTPSDRCIGLGHHALPDYYYAVLNGTPHSDAASDLLLFLHEKGTSTSQPR